MELGGYEVPKGTLLFLSMGGMHASPHNYLEPHRFYPVSVAVI
jgi:cytochrome P450